MNSKLLQPSGFQQFAVLVLIAESGPYHNTGGWS